MSKKLELLDSGSKEQLVADYQQVLADAEALLKATADQGGEKLAEIRARAEQSILAVKARVGDAQDALLAKTQAAAKATDVYVHENPWESIGIAAGAGLVVGFILGRR